MHSFEEPIHYQNPALHIKVNEFADNRGRSEEPIEDQMWHYHKEVELIWVRQGAHEVYTPNQLYILNAGDVIIIGANQLHRTRPVTDDVVYIVLHVVLQPYFDPPMMQYYRCFSEVSQPLEALNYIFQENTMIRAEVGQLIDRMHEEISAKAKGYEIAASMYIKQLLLLLLRGDAKEILQSNEMVNASVMSPVLDYVEAHLGDKIDMEHVSRLANMSYSYFSKYFKKSFGIPFTEYVSRKRISKAVQLLMTTDMNIGEIALAVGFETTTHFYRLFKKHNDSTPKEYLQKLLYPERGR